jgi:quercetin dioxygenase-like cupin family protein
VANRRFALKRTAVRAAARKAELKHLRWREVELETLNPLLQRQLVVGHNLMLTRVLLKKGCIIPLHSHHNEQFTYILEGALKFWIDGKEIVVNAGEVLTIPPHMPHKAEALVDTVDLDVFNPPRADWINKTDEYLRGGK